MNIEAIRTRYFLRLALWLYRLNQGQNVFPHLVPEFEQFSQEILEASGIIDIQS
jgi:hypothetical protein